jgi:hypothetical protein
MKISDEKIFAGCFSLLVVIFVCVALVFVFGLITR